MHREVVAFSVECGLPLYVFYHPPLAELIQSASRLPRNQYKKPKRHKKESALNSIFERMVQMISEEASKVRTKCMNTCEI